MFTTGTVHSAVHALSLQYLNVTLVNRSQIQPHIRQIKSAIFQPQTGVQNLMTRLDLGIIGKQPFSLVTPKTSFELSKIYLSHISPTWNFTLAETGMTYMHLVACCRTSLRWKGRH